MSENVSATAAYENAIEISNLTKKYDGFTLDNISFCVPKGSIMGFIGQNGAGKSTTIKAILNIIKTDGGQISLLGMDHLKDEIAAKEQIAAVFDECPFHDSFKAKQLSIMFKGLYANWDEELFYNYLDRFNLPRNKKIGKFSKGMKMKIQIATALSHGAKLLIMDEATTGLDPVVRNEILDIFREYLQDEENSILMSSHITSDLDRLADYICFVHKGKVVFTEERNELIKQNPDYGVIVCRCEEISKGEILDALRSPICVPTVDGIKKRIRPGMGRCQGGFCSPLVTQIIAEFLGVPLSEVKKSSETSVITYGKTK